MGNKPPQALDVEEAVLGAMLVEPATIDESMEELSAGCFYDPRHRKIFEAMSALVNEHVSIDIVTVSEKLRSRGDLEEIGGPVELARLSQNIGAAAHIEYYITILKQLDSVVCVNINEKGKAAGLDEAKIKKIVTRLPS